MIRKFRHLVAAFVAKPGVRRALRFVAAVAPAVGLMAIMALPTLAASFTIPQGTAVDSPQIDQTLGNVLATIQKYGTMAGALSGAGGFAYHHFAHDEKARQNANTVIKYSLIGAGGSLLIPYVIQMLVNTIA